MVCSLRYDLKVHKGCVVACSLARRLVRRRVSRGLLCGIVRLRHVLLPVGGSLDPSPELCSAKKRKICKTRIDQEKWKGNV
jgi:hypothetical protein